eukprot:3526861-Amphidinium_carterae.1
MQQWWKQEPQEPRVVFFNFQPPLTRPPKVLNWRMSNLGVNCWRRPLHQHLALVPAPTQSLASCAATFARTFQQGSRFSIENFNM